MAQFRALHTTVLKPETDPEKFSDFMTREFLPATRGLPGCIGAELLRGYRGSHVGVASAKVDYAWITLWESVDANDAAWSRDGVHEPPLILRPLFGKLYGYAATVTLVGGFTVEEVF